VVQYDFKYEPLNEECTDHIASSIFTFIKEAIVQGHKKVQI